MSPGDIVWIVALSATVIFLLVRNWKDVKESPAKFSAGMSSILVFMFVVALILGIVWLVVAVVHWAWRHS
jgi:magnesium-transporting ATPase (P-type)